MQSSHISSEDDKKEDENEEAENYNYRHPCLGFYLQGGVQALAIMDVGVEIAMVIVLSFGIKAVIPIWMEENNNIKFSLRPMMWWYYYLYNVICIFLSKSLHDAAKNRKYEKLENWLLKSVCVYIPWFVLFLVHTVWIKWAHVMGAATFGGFGAYKLYSFWVVFCLMCEVWDTASINKAIAQMTEDERENYFRGYPIIPWEDGSNHALGKVNDPYELDRGKVHLWGVLGCGAFGQVYKAHLHRRIGENNLEYQVVAVKLPSTKKEYFAASLSELKVMSYIGHHEHIVNLIGACTSDIKKRKILIVVEFCAYGSMINYLRANRGLFVDSLQVDVVYSRNACHKSGCDGPTTLDLIKWSMQTASGMEYIASRNVIHGDLAARNVLLTQYKDIKIADFGLSRQLYHCSSYIRSKGKGYALPWKWMAVESLNDFKFSTYSDIWSFAITLWEYFTCGSSPFEEWSWSKSFVDGIKSGQLKLEKPAYASSEIYYIMLRCWSLEPKERPTFKELKMFFNSLYNSSGIANNSFVPPSNQWNLNNDYKVEINDE